MSICSGMLSPILVLLVHSSQNIRAKYFKTSLSLSSTCLDVLNFFALDD